MSWLKPKSVENYRGMESEEPFGDEMPNFDNCRTVFKELFKDIDVLDVDVKTGQCKTQTADCRPGV